MNVFGNPDTMAANIAEAAAQAWWRSNCTAGPEVPLGVIAALSLVRGTGSFQVPAAPSDIASTFGLIARQTPDGLIDLLRHIWEQLWLTHPSHVEYSRLLHDWLNGEVAAKTAHAVQDVARAAIGARLLDYTMTSRREDADLLAWTLQILSGKGASAAKGFFHTSPDIAELLSRLLSSPVPKQNAIPAGSRLGDETGGGTGTLLRAAAELIRQQGGDPATMKWFCNDSNPLAAACVGVNAIVWGLGDYVVVGAADIFPDPLWHIAAIQRGRAAIALRDRAVGEARVRIAMERTAALTGITVRWPTDEEIAEEASHRELSYARAVHGLRQHSGVAIVPRRQTANTA